MHQFPEPRRWTLAEIERDARTARDIYAERRPIEGRDAYLTAYATALDEVATVFAATDNLHNFGDLLARDQRALAVARYLCAPPVSADDLATIAGLVATTRDLSLSAARTEVIIAGLDAARFPWLDAEREPTLEERSAAIQTTAALMAAQAAATVLRNRWARRQEGAVAQRLVDAGYEQVPRRRIMSHLHLPPGQFCPESMVFGTKSDVPVGLRNGRYLLIECKVSGSEVNSVKRLNRETVNKRAVWNDGFGGQAYTAAVLGGVFAPQNVAQAQEAGVFIFWEHDLDPLSEFLAAVG